MDINKKLSNVINVSFCYKFLLKNYYKLLIHVVHIIVVIQELGLVS